MPEPESGFFLQKGYRQEFSVDWPEAPQCPLVGLPDDLRQLRWRAEFAGELCDRYEHRACRHVRGRRRQGGQREPEGCAPTR